MSMHTSPQILDWLIRNLGVLTGHEAPISVADNVAEMGVNSLSWVTLQFRFQMDFGASVGLDELMADRSVKDLADALDGLLLEDAA